MKKLLYIVLAVALFSCRLQSKLVQSTKQTSHQSDSTYYSKIISVDTVTIPADTLRIEVPIEVFKRDTTIIYKEGRATTKIIYQNGMLQLDTRCDSLTELVLSTQEKLFEVHKKNEELIKNREQVIVKPVRWYHKAALWISIIITGLFILKLLIKKIQNSIT